MLRFLAVLLFFILLQTALSAEIGYKDFNLGKDRIEINNLIRQRYSDYPVKSRRGIIPAYTDTTVTIDMAKKNKKIELDFKKDALHTIRVYMYNTSGVELYNLITYMKNKYGKPDSYTDGNINEPIWRIEKGRYELSVHRYDKNIFISYIDNYIKRGQKKFEGI